MYREHEPMAMLAPYVECFWELVSDGAPQRVLPDGAMDVLFVLGESAARVIGPMTRPLVTEPRGPTAMAGARFRPGAALELLGIVARDLRDHTALVGDAWGARGRALDGRLAHARRPRDAILAIETELASRVASARSPDSRLARAIAALRAAGGELPIPAVSAGVGLSERQLERLFEERVGYGPKLFARVVRLERSTRAIRRSGGAIASWPSLAIDSGYSDQAHLVREFRALTGVTPVAYARERAMSEIDNRPAHRPTTVGP